MANLARMVISEPEIGDARHYAFRVKILSALYIAHFAACLVGCGLLLWQSKLFVTLAQRSNVETLTLAFFFVFFAYLATLTSRGAITGSQVLYHFWRGTTPALPPRAAHADPPTVATSVAIEQAAAPLTPFELRIGQGETGMGCFRIDGARIAHCAAHGDCDNNAFAYLVGQIRTVVGRRTGAPVDVAIVEWKKLDEETAEKYLSMVTFAANLSRRLDAGPLWPTLQLQPDECAEIERRLDEVARTLRLEALLPDWEYRGEHKLPIIPEPLGLLTLSVDERRVDPLTSMGAALVVVILALGVFAYMAIWPPWVPGT
jgi:hypothetical protein